MVDKKISSIELKYIIDELQFLKGSRIDKIYQEPKKRDLRIKFYVKSNNQNGKDAELFISPERIHLTLQKRTAEEPTSFCMFLRKYLRGKTIKSIQQHKFDRVIEIFVDDYILICELFHHGNYILCDAGYDILLPFEFQKWKDREILPKKKYIFPKSLDITDKLEVERSTAATDLNAVSFLANIFGSLYADEICLRSGINKLKKIEKENFEAVYTIMKNLISEKPKPQIILKNDKLIDAVPFDLEQYKDFDKRYANSFNLALDEFFSVKEKEDIKEMEVKEKTITKEKKKRIFVQIEKATEKYEKKQVEKRNKADLIYKNYGLIENILSTLKNARLKYDWQTIKEIIQKEDSPEANAIKEVREHDGIVVVVLDGEEVELNIVMSVEQNAAQYYEQAKFAKRKKEKTETSAERMKKVILPQETKERIKKETKPQRKKWYENFRYFRTSDGFLVVAGKDAVTNEKLIKKYTKQEDIILHTDIQGASFAVVKLREDARKKSERNITPVAVKEAGEFAACYSKAWQMGLGSADVYWVRLNQVSKTPPPGQYLPKGSFMIYGEKNYLKKLPLRLAVGVTTKGNALAGPLQAVNIYSKYFVTIQPGSIFAHELAEQIKNKLLEKCMPEDKELIEKIQLDEIQRLIPSGQGALIS